MKRRPMLVALSMAIGLSLAAASSSSDAQQFKYTLADAYGPAELLNQNMQAWADEIRKNTNGGLQIAMHFNGSLYKNPDIKRAVQTGQIEFGSQFMQNLGPEKRLFEIDGIPFLVRDYDEVAKLWEVSRPYLARHMEKQGLRLLYAAPWPSQAFFVKKEVNQLADMKGLRQRAQNELTSRLAQLMGTVPTTVQLNEITQAMATGTIQAFSTSTTTAVTLKLWEVASHFYDANAWIPKQMVFINEQAFAKLPAQMQKAVLAASANADRRGLQMSRDNVEGARKKLMEMGMKGGVPGPTLLKELHAIGDTMRNEWLQKADDDAKQAMAQFMKAVGR